MAKLFTPLPSSPGPPFFPSSPGSPYHFRADITIKQTHTNTTNHVMLKMHWQDGSFFYSNTMCEGGHYRRSSITGVSFRSCAVVILSTCTLLDRYLFFISATFKHPKTLIKSTFLCIQTAWESDNRLKEGCIQSHTK